MKNLFLIAAVLVLACIMPVSADIVLKNNNTVYDENGTLMSSSYFHDSGYVPETYVWIAIVLGFISLEISTFVRTDINVFLLITPIFWGWAAWFSAYMEREIVTAVNSGSTTQIVYTEIVFAQPILQYIMTFASFLAVVYAIYILFLRDRESSGDGNTTKKFQFERY